MSQQKRYNICTLAETPRVPEHCIEYAYIKLWNEEKKTKFNKDSKEDMTWVYEKAKKRAETYGIQGVTYMLTMGVIKNIIPAVATTNAIIAASCVNEAIKCGTGISAHLDNEMIYNGQTGIYGNTYQFDTSPNCYVCKTKSIEMQLNANLKLEEFIQMLKLPPYNLKNPSITSSLASLYLTGPKSIEQELKPNLQLTFKYL